MDTPDPARRDFFDSVYREAAPWDIGAAQPDLLALFEDYPPAGRVLDVGCGTGDLAIAAAQRGLEVIGIDLATAALEEARARMASAPGLPGSVEFREADALHPSQLGETFDAVLDSGFYHVFGSDERALFARELGSIIRSGGRYYVLGFAVEFGLPNTPKVVTEDELNHRFGAAAGWQILTIRPARFMTRMFQPVPAIAACIERRT